MNYHVFPGNILHLSPAIIKEQVAAIKRICPSYLNQNFFCVIMYYDKILYDNVETNPYDKVFREIGVSSYRLFYSFWDLYRFIMTRENKSQIIYHKKLLQKEQVLINISLRVFKYRLLRRCSMVCWGAGDLAVEHSTKMKQKIANYVIRDTFRKYRTIVAISQEDYSMLKKEHPRCQGVYAPYLRISPLELLNPKKRKERPLVMVSHSGWPHNRHHDSFELLSKYAGAIDVLCPLCYGDEKYIKQVIEEGNSVFGNGFRYFRELMEYMDYQKLLLDVDIFVSSAECQTGLGAISLCISGGSRLFLTENLYNSMKCCGYVVDNVHNIANMSFYEFSTPLSDEEAHRNVDVRNYESYDGIEFVERWRKLYQN